jgi:thiamine-monophosphate kinase
MGEFELLARVRERLPPLGPRVRLGSGDDSAITVPGGATATSVDALVEGVHFNRAKTGLEQIGRKSLAVALSDLAAMGADPGEAYVVLGVPADLDEDDCLRLLDGIAELAAATGTSLVGGDVTRAPVLTLATTVVGHAARPELLVSRGGGSPGDVLALTGEIGAAAAGLLVQERPEIADSIPVATSERLRARQDDPQPRLDAGAALARCGATAMIDLSDGLGGDARHLAEQSGVAARIDAAALPIAAGVAETAEKAGLDPTELAVTGGEDYELLAALPRARLQEAVSAVGETGLVLTPIGELATGEGVEIKLPGGGLVEPRGFDQLA